MKGRIAVTVVVGIVLIAYTTGASLAVFNAETTNPTNKFASGTLVLSNKVNSNSACLSTAGGNTNSNANTACDTLFSLSVKKPGDSGSGNLTLQNVGSLAASALKLYTSACADADATGETYHGTGSICGVIQLTIQQWTSNTFATPQTCIYGGGTASTCDWSDTSKTLGAYATAHTGSRADAFGVARACRWGPRPHRRCRTRWRLGGRHPAAPASSCHGPFGSFGRGIWTRSLVRAAVAADPYSGTGRRAFRRLLR